MMRTLAFVVALGLVGCRADPPKPPPLAVPKPLVSVVPKPSRPPPPPIVTPTARPQPKVHEDAPTVRALVKPFVGDYAQVERDGEKVLAPHPTCRDQFGLSVSIAVGEDQAVVTRGWDDPRPFEVFAVREQPRGELVLVHRDVDEGRRGVEDEELTAFEADGLRMLDVAGSHFVRRDQLGRLDISEPCPEEDGH